jgi:hypothetical protein
MNDFPIPEDPPVMITAEKFLSAASGEGIGLYRLDFCSRSFLRLRLVKQES